MAMSPMKQVKYLDEKGMGNGGQGGINRLSSGVASTVGFTDLSVRVFFTFPLHFFCSLSGIR